MQDYPILYKRDSKGKLRSWMMQRDGDQYRTVSGLLDGEKVTTGWTVAKAKNPGKKNETTPEQQADLEVNYAYKDKLSKEYFDDISKVDDDQPFKPMLAEKYPDLKSKIDFSKGVWSQPKLDGFRCLATKNGLFTREGKPYVCVPHIVEALERFFDRYPNVVLDGELYNHDLRDDFNTISSLCRQTKPTTDDLENSRKLVQYHIYDIAINDDFPHRHIMIKRELMEEFEGRDTPLRFVYTKRVESFEEIDEEYGKLLEEGYEGQMIRLPGPYENKRSKKLLKRKDFFDAEFKIVRIVEGKGNWGGYAKMVVAALPDGREFGAGIKGNQEFTKNLLAVSEDYVDGEVTIRYPNLTPDGFPRFGIAIQFFVGKRDI